MTGPPGPHRPPSVLLSRGPPEGFFDPPPPARPAHLGVVQHVAIKTKGDKLCRAVTALGEATDPAVELTSLSSGNPTAPLMAVADYRLLALFSRRATTRSGRVGS